MKIRFSLLLVLLITFGCEAHQPEAESPTIPLEGPKTIPNQGVRLKILGTIQDAGSPQIGCQRDCCRGLFEKPDPSRRVSSLGLYDGVTDKKYLFDATPDLAAQARMLKNMSSEEGTSELPDGIFLTHAHVGHYTGLMYLGKEATNANAVPVYAMSRMKQFLSENGPWQQLVTNKNIELRKLQQEQPLTLSSDITVVPILVPHRDEYSETVGYRIDGPTKKALFIPDIDKWEKWDKNIIDEIAKVDYAFLDATFYSGTELGSRDISQIPHPFVIESLEKFKGLAAEEKAKIVFLHFNHTNPLINPESSATSRVLQAGFKVGRIHQEYEL